MENKIDGRPHELAKDFIELEYNILEKMAQIDVTDHGLDCLMVGSLGGDDDGVVVQMWACQWR